jgi:metallo-beta-lactamase class B
MADGLWYVGDKKVSVHLIETNEGLILLDAGYPNAAHLVVDSIWRAGFDPKDVKWILHSHLHFDHFGVSSEFQSLYGTKLAISSVDAASIRERPDRTHLDSGHSSFLKNPVFDLELEDGEIFEFGGVKIRCVLTPGHTLGVMSFFFDAVYNGKTYLAGMLGGAGTLSALNRFSMEAEGLPLDMPQRMIRSLDYLMNEPVTLHLGNHPYNSATFEKRERQLREGGNPFVDDGTSWREFLLRTKDKCEKIIQDNAEREEELRRLFG